jgi:hypothetical protein
MFDDQSLQIFTEIVSKLEAAASANQSMSKSLLEMKSAMIKLTENQVALQQSNEAILLTAQRAEEQAKRAENSWSKAEQKIDNFAKEVGINHRVFVQSVAQFKQLESEWDSFSKRWEYRIANIEAASLPALHETVEIAVAEVDKKMQCLKQEMDQKYLTIEKYKDDLQDGAIAAGQKKIEEYEGIVEKIKALIKRGGGWFWGFFGAIVILIKDQIPWGELWEWLVDLLFEFWDGRSK